MRKNNRKIAVIVALMALLVVAVVSVSAAGFNRAPVYNFGGDDYIIKPIPGHDWTQAGPEQAVGKHYNTGPQGAPSWWATEAPDGELLYIVHGIVDDWSPEIAEQYASRGYVHYHELVSVIDGLEHPEKVIWLKHTARTSFNFDGGPPHAQQMFGPHEVTPGVDYEFFPNWVMPYPHHTS